MEILFSIMLGVGLATACGFKVFVPFLIISIASLTGHMELSQGFDWIGTYPALIVFLVATILEIVAYYVPYVDNALDVISTPVTVISGVLVTASCIQGTSPMMTWVLSVIIGATVSGGVKAINSGVRAATTTVTGGLGNNVVNTIQIVLSFAMSILAIILPFLMIILLIIFLIVSFKLFKKFKNKEFKFQQKKEDKEVKSKVVKTKEVKDKEVEEKKKKRLVFGRWGKRK